MSDFHRQERNWRIRVTAWDVVGILSSVGFVVCLGLLVWWFWQMGK